MLELITNFQVNHFPRTTFIPRGTKKNLWLQFETALKQLLSCLGKWSSSSPFRRSFTYQQLVIHSRVACWDENIRFETLRRALPEFTRSQFTILYFPPCNYTFRRDGLKKERRISFTIIPRKTLAAAQRECSLQMATSYILLFISVRTISIWR